MFRRGGSALLLIPEVKLELGDTGSLETGLGHGRHSASDDHQPSVLLQKKRTVTVVAFST